MFVPWLSDTQSLSDALTGFSGFFEIFFKKFLPRISVVLRNFLPGRQLFNFKCRIKTFIKKYHVKPTCPVDHRTDLSKNVQSLKFTVWTAGSPKITRRSIERGEFYLDTSFCYLCVGCFYLDASVWILPRLFVFCWREFIFLCIHREILQWRIFTRSDRQTEGSFCVRNIRV